MASGPIDADSFNAFEAAGWEQKAAGYDRFFGEITGRVVDPLLDAAGVAAGRRVLDVASGPGYVAARAAERGADVVGVDVADAMVALASERHAGLEFRQADAHDLPFSDASFDAVVANFLVLHLDRPEEAVAKFERVLAPGGRLALTVWDLPTEARFLGVFLDAVAAVGASPPEEIPPGPDFFRFSPRGLRSAGRGLPQGKRAGAPGVGQARRRLSHVGRIRPPAPSAPGLPRRSAPRRHCAPGGAGSRASRSGPS